MKRTMEHYHRDVISGAERGLAAGVLRGALAIASPAYAGVVLMRNRMFDRGLIASARAGRPVVSVGNITTGGTGKTPVVRGLVERLCAAGHHPAILMRGYKARAGEAGDEQRLLQQKLPGTIVEANPSRIDAARHVLDRDPQVDLFVMDDGFQHRKLCRDFDLVLIDASNPFGFGHVLPRGLLREPVAGLKRADAFLITHTELAAPESRQQIAQELARLNSSVPIYRCSHVQTSLYGMRGERLEFSQLAGHRVMSFCGIGNPAGFEQPIVRAQANLVAAHRFGDHHHYTASDLQMLQARARDTAAEMLITTEKDWVKLSDLAASVRDGPPIWHSEMTLQFEADDEAALSRQIEASLFPDRET